MLSIGDYLAESNDYHLVAISTPTWQRISVMVCGNNFSGPEEELADLKKVSQPTEGKGVWETSQKGSFLVFWKVKVGKGVFRPARCCSCNLTILVVLVLMVCASCLDYLEGLTVAIRIHWVDGI